MNEITDGDAGIGNISRHALGDAGAEKLTHGVIWAYSMPRVAFGIMGVMFGTYFMKYSTDVLLIAPAAIGMIMAVARLWDAVSDPMVGYWSDRTNHRWGRRRSWMFFAAVPLGLGLVMLWSPPSFVSGIGLIVWVTMAIILYETASTAYFVPHGALGVELTPNYHERTRLYGYGHIIGALGTAAGLASLYFMDIVDDKRSYVLYLSLYAGVFITSVVLWSTSRLPERVDFQGRGGSGIWRSFGDVFRNPHARLLLFVFAIETFGAASTTMLAVYLIEYVWIGMAGKLVLFLVIHTIAVFAFTPVWVWLSRRIGKKVLWAFSMWLNVFGFICFFLVTEIGPLVWIAFITTGIASGCGLVVAPAIQADVIDYDEYLTNERKEGTYHAAWNLVRKGAGSVTALATGLALQYSGFEPNVEQNEATQWVLRALIGLAPACCYVIGALMFMRFSFNEAEHTKIRALLVQRRADASTTQA